MEQQFNKFEKTPKEKFFELCRIQVIENMMHGHPYNLDLTQEQFDKIVQENKLNPAEAINWIFDSGLYFIDDSNNGWFCPSIRQEIFDKQSRQF